MRPFPLVFLWLTLLLAGVATGQQAVWSVDPANAAIGEPTYWRLDVEHDAVDTVVDAPDTFGSAGAWIEVTDGPRIATVPAPLLDGRERAVTSLTWTVIGTEPGEALGPELKIGLESGLPLEWVGGSGLQVQAELDPSEDEPRGLPVAPGWDGLGQPGSRWPLALALVALAGGVFLLVRRLQPASGAKAEESGAGPSARLRELLDSSADANAQAVGYCVGGALREATEAVTGKAEPGHAVPEWLNRQDAAGLSLAEDKRASLEQLLERADNLKFGPAEGRLGQRELAQKALEFVDHLDGLPRRTTSPVRAIANGPVADGAVLGEDGSGAEGDAE